MVMIWSKIGMKVMISVYGSKCGDAVYNLETVSALMQMDSDNNFPKLLNWCQMAKTIENPYLFKLNYLLQYLMN